MSLSKIVSGASQIFDKLPQGAQRLVVSPYLRKGLAILVAWKVLKAVNSYISQCSQNNWVRIGPWDPTKELAVLTGGSSGIGKQILEDLAKVNVKVIILDIQEPTFELPPNTYFYHADITSLSVVKAVANEIRKEHGNPTILINNAGVGFGKTLLDSSEANIRLTLDVNTTSHFWTVKEFLPAMIQKDHGHIITLASVASFITVGELTPYCCSKAAALAFHEGLTQEIRHWYKSQRIRTSIIHPFWVRTPLIDNLLKEGNVKTPMMSPKDVSSAVVKQIVSQNGGQVILPSSQSSVSLLRSLPSWLQDRMRNETSLQIVRLRQLAKERGEEK
ncbi:short-chain dehydrogenases/reductase [Penicillium canariense]|uniref:Short-chain dehydrogenase/reductase 3 n=1 Tax=Penicillium canariense TaxID=189055 RepID=A0A9W9LLY5_9EURO|nr:short-chain dehydrogenases/reductase [Penicillium canariense]KAJ5166374.1 short-chain dehydrogenases/reductase [Penicillium canariense]